MKPSKLKKATPSKKLLLAALDNTAEIGKRIKEVRLKHDETQLELAEVMGVSVPAIGSIETNRYTINLPMLRFLKRHYNVSYDYILDGEGENDMSKENEVLKRRNRELENQVESYRQILYVQNKLLNL